MSVKVRKPGLYTTVQDLGRRSYRGIGVPAGGAADTLSLRIANVLVGNPEGAAALEITLRGPVLEFREDAVIALFGAEMSASVNGTAIEPGRPVYVPAGGIVEAGSAVEGCRAYLALTGGIGVPEVLGSRSTYARARFGGLEGRPLAADDLLPVGPPAPAAARLRERLRLAAEASGGGIARAPWFAAPELCPAPGRDGSEAVVRTVPGKEAPLFRPDAAAAFYGEPFTVRPASDRMGARLAGPPLSLAPQSQREMISEAVCAGAVQVPPDGQPIVLLADAQTAGGYPRIAHVASVDLPRVAQARPGDTLRFRSVSLADAEMLYLERELELYKFRLAVTARIFQ